MSDGIEYTAFGSSCGSKVVWPVVDRNVVSVTVSPVVWPVRVQVTGSPAGRMAVPVSGTTVNANDTSWPYTDVAVGPDDDTTFSDRSLNVLVSTTLFGMPGPSL